MMPVMRMLLLPAAALFAVMTVATAACALLLRPYGTDLAPVPVAAGQRIPLPEAPTNREIVLYGPVGKGGSAAEAAEAQRCRTYSPGYDQGVRARGLLITPPDAREIEGRTMQPLIVIDHREDYLRCDGARSLYLTSAPKDLTGPRLLFGLLAVLFLAGSAGSLLAHRLSRPRPVWTGGRA